MKKTIAVFGIAVGLIITMWEKYLNYLSLDKSLMIFSLFLFFLTFIFIKFNQHYFRKIAKGAPYVPTDDETIQNIIALSEIKTGEKVVDLGSGDGKMIIQFAKKGAIATGYEISPVLVWITKYKIWKNKLRGKALVYKKDFWKEDLSQFDVVILFGIPYIMDELEQKLSNELSSHARIVSNKFEFPSWKAKKKMGRATLYTLK